MKNDRIKTLVYNDFHTKNGDSGYTNDELILLVQTIKKDHPYFSDKKMQEALFGNTCIIIDEEIVNYKHDVLSAVRCGIENRNQTLEEWD